MWSNPGPIPSQKWQLATTASGTTVTVTLAAGELNSALQVIDNIVFSGVSSGSGISTLSVNGSVIAQVNNTAAQAFSQQLDFSAGWPQWNASASDLTPVGSNAITLTMPATITNATVLVCFHYINPATLRN